MQEVENSVKTKGLLQKIKPRQMIYPILIGFSVVAYMLYSQLSGKKIPFDVINFTSLSIFWLFIALLFMASRDFGYMIRLKVLSNNKFTWRQAFRVIMLWEFTSAVTPSVVGGTSLAIIYVHKEGVSVGESSAIVMATSFLDELYFILMFPLLFLLISPEHLFSIGSQNPGISFENSFFYFAVIGYSVKFAYTLFISYGLFINPQMIKRFILWVFKLKFLRRFRKSARKAGFDLVNNSKEFKKKSFLFWLKAFMATAFSWTARYWVVNAMFVAFFVVEKGHFLLFGRQLVMWIMMLVSPTPGGSGFSEYVFSEYLGDFLPPVAGIAIIMAFIWRLFTYYPYLFIGAVIVPKWIKSKFGQTEVE